MTREEAKRFLINISYKFGDISVEYLTEKDGEKMREAINILEQGGSMTREEAKEVFLNRGYVEVDGGIIYDPEKWRKAYAVISEWLKDEPKKDIDTKYCPKCGEKMAESEE